MTPERAKFLSNPFNIALITLGLVILISYLVYWDVLPDKQIMYKRLVRFLIYMGIALAGLYYYQMRAMEELYYDKLGIAKGRQLIDGAAETSSDNVISPNFDDVDIDINADNEPPQTVTIEPVLGL